MAFNKHFNKEILQESAYFQSLQKLMSCVEKNAGRELTPAQEERVCGKEYKQWRLQAFQHQILYQYINK